MISQKNNAKKITKRLKKINDSLMAEMTMALESAMRGFVGKIQQTEYTGKLNVRTGNLRRNWKVKSSRRGTLAKVKAYNPTKYAAIHEYGGTIRAKNKYLAIPINKEAEGLYKQLPPGGSLRQVPGLLFVNSSSPFLARQRGDGSLDYLFSLKPSVYIPKRTNVLGRWRSIGRLMLRRSLVKKIKELAKRT